MRPIENGGVFDLDRNTLNSLIRGLLDCLCKYLNNLKGENCLSIFRATLDFDDKHSSS